MKFLYSVVVATLMTPSCNAFTPPRSSIPSIPRIDVGPTTVGSTVVEEADTTLTQSTRQLSEEDPLNSYISQAAVASRPAEKSYLDDGFVFGLEGSGLERSKGKKANVVVEGDSLETTPKQVAIVSSTFAAHAIFSANAIHTLFSQTDGNIALTAAISAATVFSSWAFADFGSGVLHWSVDNYGNGRTPVMGNLIAAFQGHHSSPWTITYRGFCNNVWKLCIPFGIPTITAITLLAGHDNPMVSLFFSVFCSTEIMSQEFHKWSHQTKKEVPEFVNTLQDIGLSIGRVSHARHHIAPYDGNYCIVSGLCNETLDKSGFFRFLEHKVYDINGVEPNSWKLDPELKAKTLRGEYALE